MEHTYKIGDLVKLKKNSWAPEGICGTVVAVVPETYKQTKQSDGKKSITGCIYMVAFVQHLKDVGMKCADLMVAEEHLEPVTPEDFKMHEADKSELPKELKEVVSSLLGGALEDIAKGKTDISSVLQARMKKMVADKIGCDGDCKHCSPETRKRLHDKAGVPDEVPDFLLDDEDDTKDDEPPSSHFKGRGDWH